MLYRACRLEQRWSRGRNIHGRDPRTVIGRGGKEFEDRHRHGLPRLSPGQDTNGRTFHRVELDHSAEYAMLADDDRRVARNTEGRRRPAGDLLLIEDVYDRGCCQQPELIVPLSDQRRLFVPLSRESRERDEKTLSVGVIEACDGQSPVELLEEFAPNRAGVRLALGDRAVARETVADLEIDLHPTSGHAEVLRARFSVPEALEQLANEVLEEVPHGVRGRARRVPVNEDQDAWFGNGDALHVGSRLATSPPSV